MIYKIHNKITLRLNRDYYILLYTFVVIVRYITTVNLAFLIIYMHIHIYIYKYIYTYTHIHTKMLCYKMKWQKKDIPIESAL